MLIDKGLLRYSSLRMATFERVAFENSQLIEADFYRSKLHNVSFAGSELIEVNVDACEFDQVDLREAHTLELVAVGKFTGVLIAEEQVMELAYQLALATGVAIDRPEAVD